MSHCTGWYGTFDFDEIACFVSSLSDLQDRISLPRRKFGFCFDNVRSNPCGLCKRVQSVL